MDNKELDKTRAEFETWALDNDYRIERRNDPASNDTYFFYETEQRWIVWEAAQRAALARAGMAAPTESNEKIEEIRALLSEAHGFKSTSKAAQDNINAALDLLDANTEFASPAAAVPEGALPPLPVEKVVELADQSEYTDPESGNLIFDRLGFANAVARAAVEADRARQQDMSVRLAGAPARYVSINERVAFQALMVDLMCSVRNGENLTVQSGKVQALTDFIDSELEAATRCRAQRTTIDKLNSAAPVSSTPTSGAVEGWQWVPVEPTEVMVIAFAEAWFSKVRCIDDHDMTDAYTAMLAAAPQPPEAKAGN